MSTISLLTLPRRIAASLMLAIAASAMGADAPLASKPTPTATTKADDPSDPFTGDYVGTFHPLGTYDAKAKTDDAKGFKSQKCGTCHAEATIGRSEGGYLFTLLVDHGKDKDGKPKRERIVLKAEPHAERLSFRNEKYSIAVSKGEASGDRTGRMAAEIKLKRKDSVGWDKRP